jgi:hypothetical protein
MRSIDDLVISTSLFHTLNTLIILFTQQSGILLILWLFLGFELGPALRTLRVHLCPLFNALSMEKVFAGGVDGM